VMPVFTDQRLGAPLAAFSKPSFWTWGMGSRWFDGSTPSSVFQFPDPRSRTLYECTRTSSLAELVPESTGQDTRTSSTRVML
jgi:hypothetical protein